MLEGVPFRILSFAQLVREEDWVLLQGAFCVCVQKSGIFFRLEIWTRRSHGTVRSHCIVASFVASTIRMQQG